MHLREEPHEETSKKGQTSLLSGRKYSKCYVGVGAALVGVVALSVYLWGFGGMEAISNLLNGESGVGAFTNSTDTFAPTSAPTLSPDIESTSVPTSSTESPTVTNATISPTLAPSVGTATPTSSPNDTGSPTSSPNDTGSPTSSPNDTGGPTLAPSVSTLSPTSAPSVAGETNGPTLAPSILTEAPTLAPSEATNSPTSGDKTAAPTWYYNPYYTKAPTDGVATPSPTVATNQPTASTGVPTGTESPTTTTEAPTVSTNAPTTSTGSPTISTSAPTVSTGSPTASTESPTGSSGSPTTETPTISTSAPTPPTGANSLDYVRVVFTADSSTSATVRTAFENAAKRWSNILRNFQVEDDQVPANFLFNANAGCSLNTDAVVPPGPISQLTIAAEIVPIDGPGRILGQAGFCGVFQLKAGTQTTFVPLIGQMTFDTADLASLENAGTLEDVILHEMGHVIGIGTLWSVQFTIGGNAFPQLLRDAVFQFVGGNLVANPQNQPFYTGANGKAAFAALGGSGDIPVEDGSFQGLSAAQILQGQGRGSVDSHWLENQFVNELMTPALNGGGVANPLSDMSIRSLEDMSYDVDTSFADSYTIPGSNSIGSGHNHPPADKIDMNGDIIMPSPEAIERGIQKVQRRARSMRRLTGRGPLSVFSLD